MQLHINKIKKLKYCDSYTLDPNNIFYEETGYLHPINNKITLKSIHISHKTYRRRDEYDTALYCTNPGHFIYPYDEIVMYESLFPIFRYMKRLTHVTIRCPHIYMVVMQFKKYYSNLEHIYYYE